MATISKTTRQCRLSIIIQISFLLACLALGNSPACQDQGPIVIGGCRAQNEPGHGWSLTYQNLHFMAKTDLLSHILIVGSKVYPGLALVCPGLQPPMPIVPHFAAKHVFQATLSQWYRLKDLAF